MATHEFEIGSDVDPGEVAAVLARMRQELAARDKALAARDKALAARETELATRTAQYETLREAYMALELELKLLKRRIFIASAERQDTAQLQLEFEALTKKLNALAGLEPNDKEPPPSEDEGEDSSEPPKKKKKPNRKGRRNLADADLPETEVTLTDPVMEALVQSGDARPVLGDVSYKLGRKPAEFYKIAVRHVTYETADQHGLVQMYTTEPAPELLPRCLAAPSLLADIVINKFSAGLPFYRQEQEMSFDTASVGRSSMSRWTHGLGTAFAPLVTAMDQDARQHAFVIATDATGFAIQPGPREGGPRRACRKGHYFVRIADRDHILFDYTKRHRTEDVRLLFKGFEGTVQADACSVYNGLFRPAKAGEDDDGCKRTEAGCWSHCRRKFFEAALAKQALGREGLVRIAKIFEVEHDVCRRGKPAPSVILRRRREHLVPLIDEFVEFCKEHYEHEKDRRGPVRRALGYAVRQEQPLRAALLDGRIRIDNNLSERELRKVVRIRDASFFAGSDDHAESASAHLTLIGSAKLHELNPRQYLRDIIRVLPFWPDDRLLELAPLFWNETRALLDPVELEPEVGWITVPPPRELRPTQ